MSHGAIAILHSADQTRSDGKTLRDVQLAANPAIKGAVEQFEWILRKWFDLKAEVWTGTALKRFAICKDIRKIEQKRAKMNFFIWRYQ